MLLTFPVMGIKLNTVEQTVEWQFDRILLLGVDNPWIRTLAQETRCYGPLAGRKSGASSSKTQQKESTEPFHTTRRE